MRLNAQLSSVAIRNWLTQWERDAGRGDGGLTTAEREEHSRLRRQNRQLREATARAGASEVACPRPCRIHASDNYKVVMCTGLRTAR